MRKRVPTHSASRSGGSSTGWKRRLFSVIAVGTVAAATIFSGAFANPASAENVGDQNNTPSWSHTWNGASGFTVKLTMPGNAKLKVAETFYAGTYTVPSTWDRKKFNSTAVPQTIFDSTTIVFDKGSTSATKSVTLKVPNCGPYQADLASQALAQTVGIEGTAGYLAGNLVDRANCTPAPAKVTPGIPVVKDFCATDNDHYGLPVGPAGVVYTRDGKDVLAEITASNTVWGTLPAGWTKIDATHARYAFNTALFPNNDACTIYVVPVTPVAKGCGVSTIITTPDGTPLYGLETPDGTYEADPTTVDGVDYVNAYFHPAAGKSVDLTKLPAGWFVNDGGVLQFSIKVQACVVPPTNVQATFPDATPATCDAPATLPPTPVTEGILYTWNKNTLNAAAASDGFNLTGATSKTYVLAPATGYQSTNPSGACYKAPTPTTTTVVTPTARAAGSGTGVDGPSSGSTGNPFALWVAMFTTVLGGALVLNRKRSRRHGVSASRI